MRGWDEFELEVVRDRKDNVVIVCSIENIDPMGVHTGDSVTVAPQMTLSDHAYQELRDAAAAVIRAVGVECGGSNIQFARERDTGELRVIEMNPRVSRSSALASKATGYPIAKVAAKLAVGYTLDEIPNDLTGTTPASFEPTLDYVVVKFPRFAFEKFPGADTDARHADEVGRRGDGDRPHVRRGLPQGRALARARRRASAGSCAESAHPWFHDELAHELPIRGVARRSRRRRLPAAEAGGLLGRRHRDRLTATEDAVRAKRRACGVRPSYRRVDSCAGEVEAASTTTTRPGAKRTRRRRTARSRASSSSAPARTGSARGSSSTTAASTRRRASARSGYEAVMVNCNPETVSTDYDTSDRLYFEPLGLEEVLAICERERPGGRRDPVRRPDAAEAGPRARGRRPPDHRDAVRRRRRRRGPRAVRRPARPARDPLPGVGDRAQRTTEARDDRRADRLPGPRPSVVRARRARDARLLLGGRPRARSTARS